MEMTYLYRSQMVGVSISTRLSLDISRGSFFIRITMVLSEFIDNGKDKVTEKPLGGVCPRLFHFRSE